MASNLKVTAGIRMFAESTYVSDFQSSVLKCSNSSNRNLTLKFLNH